MVVPPVSRGRNLTRPSTPARSYSQKYRIASSIIDAPVVHGDAATVSVSPSAS